jgi:hypothetical protein
MWVHRNRAPRRQTRGDRWAARGSLLCTTWTSWLDRDSGQAKQNGSEFNREVAQSGSEFNRC